MLKHSNPKNSYITLLKDIESIVFDLNEDNIESKVENIMNLFDINLPYSSNLIISRLIYRSFIVQKKDIGVYLLFIKAINSKEELIQKNWSIIETFTYFLLQLNSKESFYFLENMIEEKYISSNVVQSKNTLYFAHYFTDTKFNQLKNYGIVSNFFQKIEKYKKDNWQQHKQLLKEGVNPKSVVKAIRYDDVAKLQEISSQTNFDFNQRIKPSLYEVYSFVNQMNVTLIDYAAFFGSIKCFKYLLLNGSKLNNINKYAIAGGNIEIIHLCEQNNCIFEHVHEIALEFHRNNVFDYIYKKRAIRIKEYTQLGISCIKNDNYSLFLSLLDKKKSKFNEDIINETAIIGNVFLMKYFMYDYILPKNILVCVSKSGNLELMKFLLEQKGIDLNYGSKGYKVFIVASENGHIEMVKFLLEQKGSDVNAKDKYGENALIVASKQGHTEIVKFLLEQNGIDINDTEDIMGQTALMYASSKGHTEIVKLLLEQEGIDINAKNYDGSTALIRASEKGHTEIVKLLLEQEGIEINAKDEEGQTALMFASYNGHTEIVKLLLEQEGIGINAKNYNGKTALMFASFKGRTDILKLLLEQEGIDINAKNEKGQTALMIASKYGYKEIVKLLREHKAIDRKSKK